ncbi:PREDICTED: histidine triad nucleotide-binding protein 1-like isoform X1 [Papilio polytes]|uniref:histidine triad nucleotide-binding protein 1-like isoform X1 n=1 Tax=Papilio polytes TaxID=76194 RepID=UPI0006760DA2|nr:PREDICTED: histidine triad nucleotide-binding protein 1-like isoform X1 [Papilio polytes]
MLKNNILYGNKILIYEDNQCIVLEENSNLHGQKNFLVIPKKNISVLSNALSDDKKLLGHLIVVANKVAIRRGFEGNSYQITINEDLKSGKVKSIHIISKNSKGILWPIMPNSRL